MFLSVIAAKSLQSCLTLCDPTDGSPPGSAVPGILQARILEWVAISFSIKCHYVMIKPGFMNRPCHKPIPNQNLSNYMNKKLKLDNTAISQQY